MENPSSRSLKQKKTKPVELHLQKIRRVSLLEQKQTASSFIPSFYLQTVSAPRLVKWMKGAHWTRWSRSLRGQRDAAGVRHLTLLEVLDQLGQPALGGGVVFEHLGEGTVLQLVWQTLTQRLSGSEVV